MKKTLLLLTALLPMMAYSQLKVEHSGSVIIGDHVANGKLTIVNNNANNNHTVYISGNGKNGVNINNSYENTSSSESYGLKVNNSIKTSSICSGVYGYSTNTTTGIGRSIGVRGVASNSGTGYSYGVLGSISGDNGAGIFGSYVGSTGVSISGRYAGYFYGNVKVTGTIDGTLVSSSDARLKEDVQPLCEDAVNRGLSVLDVLESLTPVSFKYKKMEEDKKDTSATDDKEAVEEEEIPNPVMEKEHFGLIAQELQEVYPNLVYEKDNGYLAVNYVELIPILMQAIKELNAKVAVLGANKVNCSPFTSGEQETLSLPLNQEQWAGSSMDQNVPNPFTEKTDIAIYLPESVREATLYIYDLSGKQLGQHPVDGRGETVMTIHADKMDAGMYVYSLIADKKVVTTKKMIVVK